jgi:hypothetical protein
MIFPLKCGVTPFFMNVEVFLIFSLEKGLMLLFCFVSAYSLCEGSSSVPAFYPFAQAFTLAKRNSLRHRTQQSTDSSGKSL